ncbi:unnamed protein product, partial [Didymodactylos carnosus]
GTPDFLGRAECTPIVRLTPDDNKPPATKLKWHKVILGNEDADAGELLAAFELFLLPTQSSGIKMPPEPPKRGSLFIVPAAIRPQLVRTGIEILCWGVRNMKTFMLSEVENPQVVFEVGGREIESSIVRNSKQAPNFDNPLLFIDAMLPKEDIYAPPMNIKVKDNRSFGFAPVVGMHVIKSLQKFRADPTAPSLTIMATTELKTEAYQTPPSDFVLNLEKKTKKKAKNKTKTVAEEDIDWWSKYYASTGDLNKSGSYLQRGHETITIFPFPLESHHIYQGFNDFCMAFPLTRGRTQFEEENEIVGELKALFKVYQLPEDSNKPLPKHVMENIPNTNSEECIVRIYIIRAHDLQPHDTSGKSDPYIEIELGKTKLDNHDEKIPNTNNPIFGKMFEITTVIPAAKDLIIRIKDWDLITSDDVIGQTTIDLENRLLSKYRATCGLPLQYN